MQVSGVREIGTTSLRPLGYGPLLTELSGGAIFRTSPEKIQADLDTHSGVYWYPFKVIITGSAITALKEYLDLSRNLDRVLYSALKVIQR